MTLCLKSLRVGAIAAVVVSLWIGAANGQTPESDPPRTSWGAPDLQGVWDFRTITPLEAFTDDPDRLARFEREATVLASLNHTNIGHIYATLSSLSHANRPAGVASSPPSVRLRRQVRPSRRPTGRIRSAACGV